MGRFSVFIGSGREPLEQSSKGNVLLCHRGYYNEGLSAKQPYSACDSRNGDAGDKWRTAVTLGMCYRGALTEGKRPCMHSEPWAPPSEDLDKVESKVYSPCRVYPEIGD
jgi:hypothetical protein